jgi:hypothetical protein
MKFVVSVIAHTHAPTGVHTHSHTYNYVYPHSLNAFAALTSKRRTVSVDNNKLDVPVNVGDINGSSRDDANDDGNISLPPPMAEHFSSTSLLAVGRGQHHSRTTSLTGEHPGTNGPGNVTPAVGEKPEVRKSTGEKMYANMFNLLNGLN